MRKLMVAAIVAAAVVPCVASTRAEAALNPVPKKIDAWAWCGVHPDDPSAQAAANSMAVAAGIDATFGPCYPWFFGYSPQEPGVEGQHTPYRYVSPQTYRRLLDINANAGMKTVVYDNRVWDDNPMVRQQAIDFWMPVKDHIAAWDLGDEFNPAADDGEWDILVERWNIVRQFVTPATGIQPYTNHLE